MAEEVISDIGAAAGKVWHCLEDGGSLSATKLEELTGLGKNDVQRALGWLAREDKVVISRKGRAETFSLS